MKNADAEDVRSAALDTHLAQRAAHGFRVETRSAVQAVIVRRHRLYFVLRWFARARARSSDSWCRSISTARSPPLPLSLFAGDVTELSSAAMEAKRPL
jgi:hypothetical protein